jgi:copper chaperone CopZ
MFMENRTFTVPAIHCGHCTHTIEMEVGDIPGVQQVKAHLDNKQVFVQWDEPATWDKIKATLVEINYPPAELIQLN